MAHIMVVDDEIGIRELLSEILADEGHDVCLAENAAAARALRNAARPDLVLLDIWMPDTDGITLLKEWAANGQLSMPVVMMSGHGTIDTAVEATRIGALDFLEKPIALQKLLATVKKALTRLPATSSSTLSLAAFSRSAPLRELKKRLEQAAANSRTLMLRSAPGGITELAARTLQNPTRRWLDLGQDSNPLTLETLEAARAGLLFVDELGRLNRLQQKNLMFAVERLEKFDLHLIAGTTQDTSSLVAQGWDETWLRQHFAVWMGLPSLAELSDEIPEIASHLLRQAIESGEAPARQWTTSALNSLRQYGWPNGYDELRQAVKSIALAALEDNLSAGDVQHWLAAQGLATNSPPGLSSEVMNLPLREAREAFERLYFEYHLGQDGNNMTRLAEKSGLERTHLYRKLKDLGLRQGRREEE